MPSGYMGKILRVDLTKGKVNEEELKADVAEEYLGGVGISTRILYDELAADVDPLGPENKLILMTGPMTATSFPTSGRYVVCTKSPLTGIWVDGSSAGDWAVDFKKTGYDGIVFEGKSDKPVYLLVTDDKAEIKDASHLWGKDSIETQEILRKELDDKRAKVACIGQGGENQVLMSAVMNDEGRASGRGGVGAVMGSKNLKAVAVGGKKKVELADQETYSEIAKGMHTALTKAIPLQAMTNYGTASSLDTGWATGDVPVKNWKLGLWKEGSIAIGGKRMADTILKPHKACYMCPIRCARWIKIEEGKYAMEGPGPEYETLAALGTLCMNDNLEAICIANDLCNRYGIDTISVGSAIAFAMEAYENGVITKEDAGGLDLSWGNVDAILELIRMIGERKGLGEVLGKGVKIAAEELGKGSNEYAVHVKGMEVPMHDPRAFHSMAITYATSPRGACHLHGYSMLYEMGLIAPQLGINYKQGRFDRKGKGLAAKASQDISAVTNSAVICMFAGMALQPSQYADVLNAATGFDYSMEDILRIGERIMNLQRAFNVRSGISAQDDRLPPRLMEPTEEGGAAGKVPDVETGLMEYYEMRGWTKQGIPSKKKLKELGLEDVIQDI